MTAGREARWPKMKNEYGEHCVVREDLYSKIHQQAKYLYICVVCIGQRSFMYIHIYDLDTYVYIGGLSKIIGHSRYEALHVRTER